MSEQMSFDEVMNSFIAYERSGSVSYTWDELMAHLDEELCRQWDTQQEWMEYA